MQSNASAASTVAKSDAAFNQQNGSLTNSRQHADGSKAPRRLSATGNAAVHMLQSSSSDNKNNMPSELHAATSTTGASSSSPTRIVASHAHAAAAADAVAPSLEFLTNKLRAIERYLEIKINAVNKLADELKNTPYDDQDKHWQEHDSANMEVHDRKLERDEIKSQIAMLQQQQQESIARVTQDISKLNVIGHNSLSPTAAGKYPETIATNENSVLHATTTTSKTSPPRLSAAIMQQNGMQQQQQSGRHGRGDNDNNHNNVIYPANVGNPGTATTTSTNNSGGVSSALSVSISQDSIRAAAESANNITSTQSTATTTTPMTPTISPRTHRRLAQTFNINAANAVAAATANVAVPPAPPMAPPPQSPLLLPNSSSIMMASRHPQQQQHQQVTFSSSPPSVIESSAAERSRYLPNSAAAYRQSMSANNNNYAGLPSKPSSSSLLPSSSSSTATALLHSQSSTISTNSINSSGGSTATLTPDSSNNMLFVQVHLPDNQHTRVKVQPGRTIGELLRSKLEFRFLTPNMCHVYKGHPEGMGSVEGQSTFYTRQRIPWDTECTRLAGAVITVERDAAKEPANITELAYKWRRISHDLVATNNLSGVLGFKPCCVCHRIMLRGFKCRQCKMRIHGDCTQKMPNICQTEPDQQAILKMINTGFVPTPLSPSHNSNAVVTINNGGGDNGFPPSSIVAINNNNTNSRMSAGGNYNPRGWRYGGGANGGGGDGAGGMRMLPPITPTDPSATNAAMLVAASAASASSTLRSARSTSEPDVSRHGGAGGKNSSGQASSGEMDAADDAAATGLTMMNGSLMSPPAAAGNNNRHDLFTTTTTARTNQGAREYKNSNNRRKFWAKTAAGGEAGGAAQPGPDDVNNRNYVVMNSFTTVNNNNNNSKRPAAAVAAGGAARSIAQRRGNGSDIANIPLPTVVLSNADGDDDAVVVGGGGGLVRGNHFVQRGTYNDGRQPGNVGNGLLYDGYADDSNQDFHEYDDDDENAPYYEEDEEYEEGSNSYVPRDAMHSWLSGSSPHAARVIQNSASDNIQPTMAGQVLVQPATPFTATSFTSTGPSSSSNASTPLSASVYENTNDAAANNAKGAAVRIRNHRHPQQQHQERTNNVHQLVMQRNYRQDAERTSMIEWEIPDDEIHDREQVGSGSFGTVYKAKWHGVVALKKLKVANPTPEQLKSFSNEVWVMKRLRHTNIVLFMGCVLKPQLAIVTEWCPDASLYKKLHVDDVPLDNNQIFSIAEQTILGMEYLHSRSIIHRDLKSNNIFLKENWAVKIGDMGLSIMKNAWTGSGAGNIRNPRQPFGSILWMAPEIINPKLIGGADVDPYSEKSDVYAFGIVLYELWSGQLPYMGEQQFTIMLRVGRGELQPDMRRLRKSCPRGMRAILSSCIMVDRAKRQTFQELVKQYADVMDVVPRISRSMSDDRLHRASLKPGDYNNNNNNNSANNQEGNLMLVSTNGRRVPAVAPLPEQWQTNYRLLAYNDAVVAGAESTATLVAVPSTVAVDESDGNATVAELSSNAGGGGVWPPADNIPSRSGSIRSNASSTVTTRSGAAKRSVAQSPSILSYTSNVFNSLEQQHLQQSSSTAGRAVAPLSRILSAAQEAALLGIMQPPAPKSASPLYIPSSSSSSSSAAASSNAARTRFFENTSSPFALNSSTPPRPLLAARLSNSSNNSSSLLAANSNNTDAVTGGGSSPLLLQQQQQSKPEVFIFPPPSQTVMTSSSSALAVPATSPLVVASTTRNVGLTDNNNNNDRVVDNSSRRFPTTSSSSSLTSTPAAAAFRHFHSARAMSEERMTNLPLHNAALLQGQQQPQVHGSYVRRIRDQLEQPTNNVNDAASAAAAAAGDAANALNSNNSYNYQSKRNSFQRQQPVRLQTYADVPENVEDEEDGVESRALPASPRLSSTTMMQIEHKNSANLSSDSPDRVAVSSSSVKNK